MAKLTLTNLEETFEKVVNTIGEELQNTSTYLMRAESIDSMAEVLDIEKDHLLKKMNILDQQKLMNYNGPIIWADYNKEDFYILLDTEDAALNDFYEKVLAK